MNDPAWLQACAAWAIGLLQTGLIGWGLWQMRVSSRERNRQLDLMATTQAEHSQALAELLRRTPPHTEVSQ